jgi:hypothetical protein
MWRMSGVEVVIFVALVTIAVAVMLMLLALSPTASDTPQGDDRDADQDRGVRRKLVRTKDVDASISRATTRVQRRRCR